MDQNNELPLGEFLKKAREDAKYSIEKLSLKTRITAHVLRSLEAEDYANLPSPAYLKGFVLNYIKIFSLDEASTIQKLEESYQNKTGQKFPTLAHTKAAQKQEKSKDQDPDQVLKSENIIDATKSFVPFIIGAVVIAASIGGYKFVSNMINEEIETKKEIENSPIENLEQTTSTTEDKIQIEITPKEEVTPQEIKKEAAEERPEPQTPPTPPKVEKKKEAPKSTSQRREFPEIEFKSIPSNLYTLKPNAAENKDESLMPSSYKAKMDPNLQNLYIHAKDGETWVNYKVDQEPIQNEFIRQGKALFLQGNEIRMFFGNVNVTRIFLNNTFIDASSPTGVKTVVFPQENASKYKRPLFPRSSKGELYTSEEYIEKMKEEEQKIGNP